MLTKLAGSTFYPVPWGEISAGDVLLIIADPGNKYDKNALKVIHEPTGIHIGHVPAATALLLAEKQATCFRASVSEVTGGVAGKKNYGMNIKLTYESDELLGEVTSEAVMDETDFLEFD